jgi:uncharacterized protein
MPYLYLLLIAITLILGLGTQFYIKATYKKFSTVPITNGLTGAEAARRMLDSNGLQSAQIVEIEGKLTDNYNPQTNVLSLSSDVYRGRSIAATAVACHESGHAVQSARNYGPAKLRGSLVPVVSAVSNIWPIILIIGIFMNILGFIYAAIIFYALAVIFQIVTLPVEFDASRRGLAYIESSATAQETAGAKKVLTAAALTYVAAALASLLQLLYLIGIARR